MARISIVGAGVMGLAAARAIAQRGHDVTVYEQFELKHRPNTSDTLLRADSLQPLFRPVRRRNEPVAFKTTDQIVHERMAVRPLVPYARFDTAAFVTPSTPRYGNSAANFLEGDGVANWDLALAKRIRVREGHYLQLRVEAFNAFNHPTFGVPQYRVGNAAYGVVSFTENNARDLQLGLKYQF